MACGRCGRVRTVDVGRRALGWCGFAAPDIGEDPEILYGLAPQCWGSGLAQEMVRAAIGWLFAETPHQGVSAVIFGRLNPVSAAIAGKLGMTKRGTMAMKDFLPDLALARDVLEYEIWRLGYGRTRDAEALLFQAPFKGGQIASLRLADLVAVEQLFCDAARGAGRVRAVRSRADRAARPRCVPSRRVGALPSTGTISNAPTGSARDERLEIARDAVPLRHHQPVGHVRIFDHGRLPDAAGR